jgi:hypothetical protein
MVEYWAYHTPDEELHRRDIDPGPSAFDGGFEVFGQATVTIEPGVLAEI